MIASQLEQGVLSLQLQRPDKKNAITNAMYQQLADALTAANHDDQIRVVMISGSAGIFSAGNDLDEFLDQPPQVGEAPAFAFLNALNHLDKPLVAAIDGPAVGVGATLLLHCDLVYASAQASLVFPFIRLGVVPEAGASLFLPARLGHLRAFELLTLSDGLDAASAERLGLVNRVVDNVDAYALEQAQRLARLPTDALQTSKRLLRPQARIQQTIETEAIDFARLITSPAVIAGLRKKTGRE